MRMEAALPAVIQSGLLFPQIGWLEHVAATRKSYEPTVAATVRPRFATARVARLRDDCCGRALSDAVDQSGTGIAGSLRLVRRRTSGGLPDRCQWRAVGDYLAESSSLGRTAQSAGHAPHRIGTPIAM